MKKLKLHGKLVDAIEVPANEAENFLAASYIPLDKNKFLFKMEGLDSFTVTSVKMPSIKFQTNKYVPDGKLEVRMHDAVVENPLAKCLAILSGGSKKPASLVLLDPVGKIVKTFNLEVTPVDLNLGEYRYDSKERVELLIRFDIDSITFV